MDNSCTRNSPDCCCFRFRMLPFLDVNETVSRMPFEDRARIGPLDHQRSGLQQGREAEVGPEVCLYPQTSSSVEGWASRCRARGLPKEV